MAKPLREPCPACGYPLSSGDCDHCEGSSVAVDGVTGVEPGTGFFVGDILEGFFSLFHGSLLLMTKKEYMGKLAVAVLVNFIFVVLFAGGIFFGFYSLLDSIDWAWTWEWVQTAALALAVILAVVSTWFLAPTLINAGMTPFLDPIANATEMMLAGEKMKPVEIGFWKGMMAGINAAAQVLVLQVFVLIPVLLLSFIPVIGWFFIAFGLVYSAYLNALVWFEIPMLRRGYGWKYRRQIVRRNWARAIGFGLAFNIGLLVPFFNFLFLGPATAVAVSSLYFRFEKMTPSLRKQLAAQPEPTPEPAPSPEPRG